jgi:hypothetical protein
VTMKFCVPDHGCRIATLGEHMFEEENLLTAPSATAAGPPSRILSRFTEISSIM